jgi:copper transport protein
MHPRARAWRRWWLALPLAVGLTVGVAPAAFAHATLLGTQPSNDAVVEESPDRVVLRFDEAVESALGSVRVYDGEGRQVDAGEIERPSSDRVAVSIDRSLQRGTYTVTWRVISADSDPIDGAFIFHVQAPGPQPEGVAAQVLEDTPLVVSAFYTGGRFLDYALMLLCVGGVASLVLVLATASTDVRRRLQRRLAVVALALVVVALAGIVFQAAAAGDLPLREAATWNAVSEVMQTRFGRFSLARAVLALCLAAVLWQMARNGGRAGRARGGLALALGLGMIVTPVASGHASVSGPLSFVADYAHVAAAATWTGGLAVLVLGLWLARAGRWRLAERAVPRFSNLAVGAVAALLVAGTINGVIQVKVPGSWSVPSAWRGLWESTYGLLLLAKIALVVPLLALGAFNNRYSVPRLRAGIASVLERRRFLRAVCAELAIMVAIVGVTAFLVNAPPARTEVQMHGAVAAAVDFDGQLMAHLSVDPAIAGRNDIHLEFEAPDGEPAELDEVSLDARLASAGIGPLRFEAKPSGEHGAFVVSGAQLPIAGDWQLRVEARRGEFDVFTQTVSVPIEEEM